MSAEVPPETRRRRDRAALLVHIGFIVLGVALILVTWRGDDGPDRPATVTVMPSPENAARFQQHLITSGVKDRPQPAHTMSVVDGEFRVNSTAANSEGSRREVWTMPESYGDVEVLARIDAPSSLGGASTPQPGIALRTHIDDDGAGSALVIDANIWSRMFDDVKVGVWSWPADFGTVDVTAVDKTLTMDHRDARIRAVARQGGPEPKVTVVVDPVYDEFSPYGFRAGDRVDIQTTRDSTFDQKGALVTGVTGPVIVVDASGGGDRPLSVDGGTVRLHDPTEYSMNPRALYPRYVRVRVVGSHVRLKTWLIDRPEPGWQLDTELPASAALPETGEIGLITNHLTGAGQYMAFGALEITPIESS
ncbi:MAG TPA: hypothetical protein VFN21_13370 [Acidimicrobiales bacterium]|nr:hypothetical protein [Acidimicrobiales bacterium]